MAQFEHEGVLYEELPGGKVRVIGPAQGGGGLGPFQLSGPDPFKVSDERRNQIEFEERNAPKLKPGFRWKNGVVGGEAELIPGIPAEPKSATEIEAENKAESERKRAATISSIMGRVRELYESDIKGQPASRLFGLTEYNDLLPANDRFRSAGLSLLPLIRPLVAQSAREGDSDKEMEVFLSYVPSNDDTDASIENKFQMLETLIDGMVKGKAPSETLAQDRPQPAALPAAPQQRLNDQDYMAELDRLIKTGDRAAVDAFLKAQGASEKEPGQIDAAIAAGRGDIQRPETVDAAGGFAYGLGDMATLGFLDEAGAAVNSIIPHEGRPNIWQSGVSMGDAYNANLQANRDLLGIAQDQQGGAFLAGQVAGGIAGTAGLAKSAGGMFGRAIPRLMGGGKKAAAARTVAGESAFGAGYGAGSGTEGDRARNALIGGVAAPAGGLAGRAAVTGVGRAMAPVVSPAVQRLADAGITMTPGQIMRGSGTGLGKAIGWTEDKAMSLPIVGDAIRTARQRQMPQFQRATINEALKPLGKEVPKEMIGNEAVDYAQDVVSRAYDDALLPLRAAPDEQLQATFNAIGSQADDLPEAQRQLYYSIIQRDMFPFMPKDGIFTGKQIQSIKRGLDRHIGKLAKGSPADQMLADTLGNVRSEVMDFASRVAPAEAGGFRKANEAFARLSRVNSAAAMAPEGLFSPQQLRTAVRQGDKTSNKRATAAGNALMQDFATDASAVLPSGVPNSGTTDRALLALGTVGGGAAVSPPLLAGYSATALPYLPGLDRATQKLLIGRPDILEKAGHELVRRRGIGGMFAGPLAVSAGVGNN